MRIIEILLKTSAGWCVRQLYPVESGILFDDVRLWHLVGLLLKSLMALYLNAAMSSIRSCIYYSLTTKFSQKAINFIRILVGMNGIIECHWLVGASKLIGVWPQGAARWFRVLWISDVVSLAIVCFSNYVSDTVLRTLCILNPRDCGLKVIYCFPFIRSLIFHKDNVRRQ